MVKLTAGPQNAMILVPMSKATRLTVVAIVGTSLGAIGARLASYRAMRADLQDARRHIDRGRTAAAAIRRQATRLHAGFGRPAVSSTRDVVSTSRTERHS